MTALHTSCHFQPLNPFKLNGIEFSLFQGYMELVSKTKVLKISLNQVHMNITPKIYKRKFKHQDVLNALLIGFHIMVFKGWYWY